MWFLRFFFGFIFVLMFGLFLISLMRGITNSENNQNNWEAKFRITTLLLSAFCFGLLMWVA